MVYVSNRCIRISPKNSSTEYQLNKFTVRGDSKVGSHKDGPKKITSLSYIRSNEINLCVTTVCSRPLGTRVSNRGRT